MKELEKAEIPNKVRDWVSKRWRSIQTPDQWLCVETRHLPDEVVKQPIYLWATWQPLDGEDKEFRHAVQAYALTIGDRVNTTPTPDEADRIVARLLDLAGAMWRDYGDDRPVPTFDDESVENK